MKLGLEPGRAGEVFADCRQLKTEDGFAFVCAGCGDCCRKRKDLVLSGYDLYRIAHRLGLPPKVVAAAFCRRYCGEETLLPTICLTTDPDTGNCRFFEGNACLIHGARPLACALYPLGQQIDVKTGQIDYFVQEPLCGLCHPDGERTLREYLSDSAVNERMGIDARWAMACTQLSELLQNAGGRENPHFMTAFRRAEKALYFEYAERDEFYPQFQKNMQTLFPLLEKILQKK